MKKWIIGIIVIGLFAVSAYTGMLGTITGSMFSGNPVACDPDWVLGYNWPIDEYTPRTTNDDCKSYCYLEMGTTKFRLDVDIDGYDKCYCDVNKCG